MGITAVEQIGNALSKHRLSGPTIFRVSCAIWGTSEIDSVGRHVDMLQTVEYDRCEQIKTLLTDYLAQLDGTDEQKIQKVAELFKDWDPGMKHELLRGVISVDKASGQQIRKEKTPEQQKAKEKTPEEKTPKEKTPEEKTPKEKTPEKKTPEQQKPKEKEPVPQKAEEKVPVQQKAEVAVKQEVKKDTPQLKKADKDSDKPKEAVKDKTEKTPDAGKA